MEAIGISLLTMAARKVIDELDGIITGKRRHANLVAEVEDFKQSLEADLRLVEKRREVLQDEHPWAIESVSKDLEDAGTYLKNCRQQRLIKGLWDAKKTARELTALREKLSHKFQVKLFFTILEGNIEKEKRTKAFHSKLAELSTLSATSADVRHSTEEIKGLLKPLTVALKGHDVKFLQLRAEIKALSAPSGSENNSSLETEKFLEDILAALAEPTSSISEDDLHYYDPFTAELMYDPVKCSDGKTYDRFSVIKYNAEFQLKPMKIVCADESLRELLFNKFRHEQPGKTMECKRKEYRAGAVNFFLT